MKNLKEMLAELEELIKNTKEGIEDHADEVRDEVIDNIEAILKDRGDCDDFREYRNENFSVDIREMDEYEFNDFCREENIEPWDVVDLDVDKYVSYFGKDENDDIIFTDDLEDFVSNRSVAEEMVKYPDDIEDEEIQNELDKLENDADLSCDFVEGVRDILGIDREDEESNDELKEVISWIYEHKMLGEDFDNKFPKLAEKYKED